MDSSSGSGGSFIGLLTLLFVGLKLTGYIQWSWWWVLSPMLMAWGIALPVIIYLLWKLHKKRKND